MRCIFDQKHEPCDFAPNGALETGVGGPSNALQTVSPCPLQTHNFWRSLFNRPALRRLITLDAIASRRMVAVKLALLLGTCGLDFDNCSP